MPRSEADEGDFYDLDRNRVYDPQGPRRPVNFSGLDRLVEGLTDKVNRVPGGNRGLSFLGSGQSVTVTHCSGSSNSRCT